MLPPNNKGKLCGQAFWKYWVTVLWLGIHSFILPAQDIWFDLPDTICELSPVPVVNHSRTGASSYQWTMCSGNLLGTLEGENLGNAGSFNEPAYVAPAEDATGKYLFVTNYRNGTLSRLFFGSNYYNHATTGVNLGNFAGLLSQPAEGIQVVSQAGQWYGFVVCGKTDNARLVRLDFGASLANTPTAVSLGNPGNLLDWPVDLQMASHGGEWYGFTVNQVNDQLIRFRFGTDLTALPVAENLGSAGLNGPCGLALGNWQGNWLLFLTNFNDHTIHRYNFGSSPANSFTHTEIVSPGSILNPIDISIVADCERFYGYVPDRLGDMYRLDFVYDILQMPSVLAMGNPGGMAGPHSLSPVMREYDTLFSFAANAQGSTLTRLVYPLCSEVSTPFGYDYDAPAFEYLAPGIFNVQLVIDKGLPTEEKLCRDIIVKPRVTIDLGNDTTLCPGNGLSLDAGEGFVRYLWQDSSTNRYFAAADSGMYTVEATDTGRCQSFDTLVLAYHPDDLNLGSDLTLPYGTPATFDAGAGFADYAWNTGQSVSQIEVQRQGTFSVYVHDQNGCAFADTVILRYQLEISNYITPNGPDNEQWELPFLDNYPQAEVKIYDRWGKLVHSQQGNASPWQGNYLGKPLPSDSYWYSIDLRNGDEVFTGNVSIIR